VFPIPVFALDGSPVNAINEIVKKLTSICQKVAKMSSKMKKAHHVAGFCKESFCKENVDTENHCHYNHS